MRVSPLPTHWRACAILATALLPPALIAGAQPPSETFTGSAFNLKSGGGGGPVTVTVRAWSSDADCAAPVVILKAENDQYIANARIKAAIERMPSIGGIGAKAANGGFDVRLACQTPAANGARRIVLATNVRPPAQPKGAFESTRDDYLFKVLEMRLDQNGRGEGSISLRARFLADRDGGFAVQHYQSPVAILDIRKK